MVLRVALTGFEPATSINSALPLSYNTMSSNDLFRYVYLLCNWSVTITNFINPCSRIVHVPNLTLIAAFDTSYKLK